MNPSSDLSRLHHHGQFFIVRLYLVILEKWRSCWIYPQEWCGTHSRQQPSAPAMHNCMSEITFLLTVITVSSLVYTWTLTQWVTSLSSPFTFRLPIHDQFVFEDSLVLWWIFIFIWSCAFWAAFFGQFWGATNCCIMCTYSFMTVFLDRTWDSKSSANILYTSKSANGKQWARL